MRPNTYDDTKAYCLCKVFPPDENFTITSHTFLVGPDQLDVRITFYIKELESYICFNKRWQPRIFKKLSVNCYFKEEMDGGYFLFYSIENPDKYLGFNRRGRAINYESPKMDKQCRKIFKRILEETSSNGLSTSIIDYELTSSAPRNNNHRHSHKSSTRTHQRTHSNRIETSKSRNASLHNSSKRYKLQQQQQHHVRHHHNEQPLRHYHTISNNKKHKNIDSYDNTKQLGNEDLNAIYNHNDSGLNTISESKGKFGHHRHEHIKKPTQSVSKSRSEHNLDGRQGFSSHGHKNNPNPTNDYLSMVENNNGTNNCTYNAKNVEDETDDKYFKGRRTTKGKNTAQANDKPNNNCNKINRRHRKNNENGRHSRKQKSKIIVS
ncbi:CLUMA_CG010717, isoform A [Clunio marinus]|uniref:CLUMA_CG010717, isoform A n=1 Tax=Clunio marinus TaxID=568069 RepID=A0A1J1IAT5_9DIPT|nr:CLUMA_CG010717, isoform A [Clunio marinus]